MKVVFTVFEDTPGYWIGPYEEEAAAIGAPAAFRGRVHSTKISACREALAVALSRGASELHLHGVGATTTIKPHAKAAGIKPFVYWPAASTRIAPFARADKSPRSHQR